MHEIKPDAVHVWSFDVDRTLPVDTAGSLLSAEERARAARFRLRRDAGRFIVRRAVLRRVLARYTGIPPAHQQFKTDEFGRRFLLSGAIHFSTSHSDGFGLIALALDEHVGVDVERVAEHHVDRAVIERQFTPEEAASLRKLEPSRRAQGFFECWCLKEAFVKALGTGLSTPLDSFVVSLDPTTASRLLTTRLDGEEPSEWMLTTIEVNPGYAAALAVRRRAVTLERFVWSPGTGVGSVDGSGDDPEPRKRSNHTLSAA